ncbi:MAG: tRNA(His) guanylyltransferase Thg1 family protein [bacterium]|nr:tRNA(His) guanylyltransferase Thg1 family protein [bacterium]
MIFDELDEKMRSYERSMDQIILDDTYVIVRLDGRGFTKLTKETIKFEVPFDITFRNAMIETVKHLMDCGFRIIYGYTESDEISLLFDVRDTTFNHKVRKVISVLAGEASGFLSLKLGVPVCMDCRVIPLPSKELVVDYFSWRMEDSYRNSINAYCYWTQRKEGITAGKASSALKKKSVPEKQAMLLARGIDFESVPEWQKYGVGVVRETYLKEGHNPKTGETVKCERSRLTVKDSLPTRDEYRQMIQELLAVIC